MGSIAIESVASKPLINLQLGWPSPRLFAANGLLEGAQAVLASESETASALIYGPHIGHPPLRKSVAEWLSSVYARDINPERIAITNGASGNLSNVLQKFTDPLYTRRIFMVEPTYFLACPIFEDNGFRGKLMGVPEGEEGIDIEFLRAALEVAEKEEAGRVDDAPTLKVGKNYPKIYKHIIYIVPTFSNPSGKTLSEALRTELVRLARRYDALVISDDVYDFLSWPANGTVSREGASEAVPPRLIDVDASMEGYSKFGNTLSNGSFSKIIGPGVRVGWADGAPAFMKELAEVGSSSSGGAPSHLTSTFVDKMIRTGHLEKHIRNFLIPTYRERYLTLMSATLELLAPLGVRMESDFNRTGIAGGFFAYLRLPQDMPPARNVAALALQEHSLRVAFGHMFAVEGDERSMRRAQAKDGFGACIRLCWAWHEEDEIREGVERLRDTIVSIRARAASGEDFSKEVSIGIR